jgi:hypothetical protein
LAAADAKYDSYFEKMTDMLFIGTDARKLRKSFRLLNLILIKEKAEF